MSRLSLLRLFGLVILLAWGKYGVAQHKPTPSPLERGKVLASVHCQGCHLLPEPALLDKKTWAESVLPNMGWRLGMRQVGQDPLADLLPEEAKAIKALGIYPETPLLAEADWNALRDYYLTLAPEAPNPIASPPSLTASLPGFEVLSLFLTDKPVPKTTLVRHDPHGKRLFVGNAPDELFVLNQDFSLQMLWSLDSPATDLHPRSGVPPLLLTIGVFAPSEQRLGQLMVLDSIAQQPNIGGLPRAVQFAVADLDADGRDDAIVCGFGNHSGELVWYPNFEPSRKNVLSLRPGARRVVVQDFNNDQRPDLMVLMAQAHEELVIYYNQGNGQFIEKKILQFPPVFGVSYFELADFNKDGRPDILLTNGDNWDYSPILKNYHGIRIFLNDGQDRFSEAWFYPLYGTSKAVARDFDQDGELDIAAISFYTDLDDPSQGFVYLANQGNLTFKGYTTPAAAQGKWLTMEVADLNQDGKPDLVLGSYFQSVGELTKLIFKGIDTFPQLLILTNQHP